MGNNYIDFEVEQERKATVWHSMGTAVLLIAFPVIILMTGVVA